MKTIYFFCFALAGAALATAKLGDKPSCVPVVVAEYIVDVFPNYKCLHCQAEAVALQCTNPDIFVPTCDGDLFAKYQYHEAKNQSFCVYMDGTEITELLPYSTGVLHFVTREYGRGDPARCDVYPNLPPWHPDIQVELPTPCFDKKKEHGASWDFFACEADGTFSPKQKKDTFQWCTTRHGDLIPGTFSMEGDLKKPADCDLFRRARYDCGPVSWDCTLFVICDPDPAHSERGGHFYSYDHLCKCPLGTAWDTELNVCNDIAKVPRCAP